MADFDLDAKITNAGFGAVPTITSRSLCTPGCPTGFLGCFSRACNPTQGCTISK